MTGVPIAPFMASIIEPTVADVHRRFARWVDIEDLTQEAAVWWYGDAQKYLEEYLRDDEHHVRLRRSIWRFVARYAEKEKAHIQGYEPQDQVNYHPQEILHLLPVALDPDGLPAGGSGELDDSPKAKVDPSEGGNALAALVDVRRALNRLAEDDVHFLQLCSDLHHDWERVAAHTETLADSARRRHLRIAERMARWLNGQENAA